MLAEAAAQSRSVADVLRVLGVRFSGGSHAHISRQLKRLGIDTSHFTRRTGGGGRPSGRRTPSTQVLRPLPAGSRRKPGARPAGTVPDITAPPPAAYRPPAPAPAPAPVGAERVAEVIRQVEAGALGPSGAARRIGCHRNHVARLRRRLAATGTVAAPPRPRDGPAHQRTVIRYALARPDLGPRKLAAFIRTATGDTCVVSHGTVSNILRRAGLSTVSARRSKL